MIYNTATQYGVISKLLHWVISLLMPGMIVIGGYMTTLSNESPLYFRLLDLHETIGLSIFCLFFIKVAWQIATPRPRLLQTLSSWEFWMARIVHGALLLAMLIIPVFGYLFATAQGDEIDIYGYFDIPALVGLNKAQAEIVISLHAVLAYGAGVLIVIHILAALRHHFVDKDDVLKRMWR